MARFVDGVNKSQAIRDAFAEMPEAKAKAIVAHLQGKGIEVTEALVYQVKKVGKKKKKRGRKPGQAAAVTMTAVPQPPKIRLSIVESIALVRTTAAKVGGLTALREIIDALA